VVETITLRTIILFACTIFATQAATPDYTIPVRVRSGFRLEVSVRVNGTGPFWCTLDSGAAEFILDAAVGKNAGLRPSSMGQSHGEGPGVVQDERVLNTTLELNKLHIPHRTIVMRPLEDACLIGTVHLDRFVVEIDYLAPAIRLYAPDGYRPGQSAIDGPLTLDQDRRPMTTGRLFLQPGDAVNARLLLDSAMPDYVLSLSKAFIDKQEILKRVRGVIRPPFRGQGTGGNIDLLATRIDRLSIGPVGISNPIVMLFRTKSGAGGPQPDGFIGSGFLHRFLVIIDVPSGRLYLRPNRTYRDPEPTLPWAANLPLVR
jgi:hypothetical protein